MLKVNDQSAFWETTDSCQLAPSIHGYVADQIIVQA
jgi:hypothetical protein